jgi:hypothetical protein
VAYDAPSPFGINWGYLGLLMFPTLIVAATAYGLLNRGRVLRRRAGLVVLLTLAAGAWTFFTVGASTMISTNGHPSECVRDPWGHGHGSNAVDDACDRALAHQLIISIGPSALMLVLAVVGCVAAVRRRRRPLSATR